MLVGGWERIIAIIYDSVASFTKYVERTPLIAVLGEVFGNIPLATKCYLINLKKMQ